MAASCRTWFMTAALGSEDEEPKPRPLLMLSIFADLADLFCNTLLLTFCIRRGEWRSRDGLPFRTLFVFLYPQKISRRQRGRLRQVQGWSGITGIIKPPIQELLSNGPSPERPANENVQYILRNVDLGHRPASPFSFLSFRFCIAFLPSALRIRVGNLRVRE
jgi:hypothetical protein